MGMRTLLIDTNIYSHALRGNSDVVDRLRKMDSIGFSVISIGELLYGFKRGVKEKKNREQLEDFLDSPRVVTYCIDEETCEFYAEILNNLKSIGKPIPTNDIWIASAAFQHGLKLFTKDQHYQSIPGLSLV